MNAQSNINNNMLNGSHSDNNSSELYSMYSTLQFTMEQIYE